MSDGFDLEELASLLAMLERHDIREFKLEKSDGKLWLRRGPERGFVGPTQGVPRVEHAGATAEERGSEPTLGNISQLDAALSSPNGKEPRDRVLVKDVTSPMVGTFYRRPAIDADPYVAVGDVVKKGDVLCIVEAMKLMNEIESDVSGRVVEICLNDGQMVEYGEVLFRIEPAI